ncbi:MAG: amidohydrolase family protein [Candidatus Kariarchaeaceae archaeon]|jgi:imidazolonepropionase-like amidohydrolase
MLGVGDQVGSLEIGKDADIVIWNGDPLDSRSKPIMCMINGKVVFE